MKIFNLAPLLFFSLVGSLHTFSQFTIKGKVVYAKENRNATGASIGLLGKKQGTQADESGNFSFHIPAVRNNDTLVISSIGYEDLIMPVRDAQKKKLFELTALHKSLAPVIVKSFSTRDVVGSTIESVGYFRSWNSENDGGEIGRRFIFPYSEYKIDKIKFKVGNMCNACTLRLHIRKVIAGAPMEDLLRDSLAITVKTLSVDDKGPEFDLSDYEPGF